MSEHFLEPEQIEAKIRRNYRYALALAVGTIVLFGAVKASTQYVESLTHEEPVQIDPAGDIASQLVNAYKNLP